MRSPRRLQITVSQPMMVAIDILAERSGLPRATQALAVLRAALDRTIHSAEGQDRIRAHNADRTAGEWRADTYDEHYVETTQRVAAGSDAIG